jgi:radical SAM superfamily enzyme YgiQ (UPF0313 family)
MKVLFLEVSAERQWAVASIGPAFIASYLRKHGIEVELLLIPLEQEAHAYIAAVEARAPDLLALSMTTRQWLRGRDIVGAIRRRLDVPVVAGGLHPTFSAPEVLAHPGFDYVCLGEGEEPMLDLVRHLEARGRAIEPGSIPNLWVKGANRPALRPPFPELDALPFMARDVLDERYGIRHMVTQRGCPFPCTYCAARKYDDLYEGVGDYGRRRSHENVLAELFELERTGPLSYVIFLDDTFTINRPWVLEFCDIYREKLRKPFSLHARVETVTPDVLNALAGAGCHQITYGVESGSFRVRKEIMKRPVPNQKFKDVFRWTKEAGILVTANFMLGIPGETTAEVEETLALCDELDITDFGYFVFYPYPGTHLFHVCLENGYLPADYLDRPANHRESILNLPGLSQDDVRSFYDRFTAIRERKYAERLGSAASDTSRRGVAEALRASADMG